MIWKYYLNRVIRKDSDLIFAINGRPPTDSLLGKQQKSGNQCDKERDYLSCGLQTHAFPLPYSGGLAAFLSPLYLFTIK